MRKVFLTMALFAPLAAATPATALNTKQTYSVSFDGSQVGFWNVRGKVAPTATGCRYTLKWSDLSGPPLGRTTLCKIDESTAGDNFDCQQASKGFFDTVIQKAPGTCRAFDDFGQQTTVTTLIAGESSGGTISGVVMTASVGDIQDLLVQ